MHTPEPWFLCKPTHYGPDQENDYLIHDKAKNHIAEVFQYQSHQTPNGPSEANAYLIKAAPKMLNALEAVENFLRQKCEYDDLSFRGEIQDTIREAKGE